MAVGCLLSCAADPGRAPGAQDDGGETEADAGSVDGGPADAGAIDAGPIGTVCPAPDGAIEAAWIADPSLCLVLWANNLPGARGFAFAPNGDLFVVSKSRGIVVLRDKNGAGIANESTVFSPSGGNHGIAFHGDYLYVSSDTTVWRFAYASGLRMASGPSQIVVHDIPTGGHVTRTLIFDGEGKLLVSVGSASNVDNLTDGKPSKTRALIMQYDVANLPSGGYAYTQGTVFAGGLRNEVGLAYDSRGRLWGVENGRDTLAVNGEDIHNDNPGEELNRFDTAGAFYGYPFCWSEFDWPTHGTGRGSQHADPDFPQGHDEAWCRSEANVKLPKWVLPAHLAPLGIVFVGGDQASPPGLSASYAGDAFITVHGSWNRTPAVGRMIWRARFNDQGEVASVDPFLGELGTGGELKQGSWKYRPVDIKEGPDGALYFTDDQTGTIHRVVAKHVAP